MTNTIEIENQDSDRVTKAAYVLKPEGERLTLPLLGAVVKESILLPAWTRFKRVRLSPITKDIIEQVMQTFSISRDAALEHCRKIERQTPDGYFENSRYRVQMDYTPACSRRGAMFLLMISRLDMSPPGPERYRDFMRIRDELIGPEHDAVEVYPCRSRELDLSNTYHLWVCASADQRFAVGYNTPREVSRH